MGKIKRTIQYDVVGGDVINLDTIRDAMYEFKKHKIDEPNRLTLSPLRRNELFTSDNIPPSMVGMKEIFGMNIVVDPNLKEDEWYVGKRDELVNDA